ncbi:hypothetical protein D3C79_1088850 [compost metagenome]
MRGAQGQVVEARVLTFDQVHQRLATLVQPVPRERKRRPRPRLDAQQGLQRSLKIAVGGCVEG